MFTKLRKALLICTVSIGVPSGALAAPPVVVVFPNIEIQIGHTRPPPRRVEVRHVSPGPGYTWIQGDWGWHGNDWVWSDARWERPARRGVRWVPARSVAERGAWRHVSGHWSHQRVVRGEEYRRWRVERHNGQRHDRGHGKHGKHKGKHH